MTVLNTANKLYVGTSLASKAYLGTTQVWPAAAAYDAVVVAWAAAVVAAGGTVSETRKGYVNTLVTGLKSDGIWAKFDRLYLFASENTQSAYRDLVAPTTASVAVGSPTFSSTGGFTVDSSNYVRITYALVTNAVAYTQDAAHVSIWNLTAGAQATPMFNVAAGIGNMHIYPAYSSNDCYSRVNEASSGAFTISDPIGHIIGNRSSSTSVEAYRNGTALGGSPQAVASGGVVDDQINIYTRQAVAFSIGGSLNSTQALAFYNRLRTYMTSAGVP